MDVLQEKEVKIRKNHQCIMCLRVIEKGNLMHTQTIRDDDLYTVYTCMDCESIKHLIEPNIEGYYEEGCVLTEMSEQGFDGTIEEFFQYLKRRKPPTGSIMISNDKAAGIYLSFNQNYNRKI